jgi:DNA-binding SARP family transcriptional activator/pimeloyl-ACP methyl ester carboxylesterase/predicted ATPase
MERLKLFVFGPPRLERAGQPFDLGLRKALALFVYLAVSKQPQSRDGLAALFWPEHDQREARANLRRTLHRLTQAIGAEVLLAGPDTVALDPQAELWLDCAEFERQLAEGLPASSIPQLAAAAKLYSDDFLAGFSFPDCPAFDEWQFFIREELRRSLAQVVAALARAYCGREQWEAAIAAARRWVALDPLHEPAQRALIEIYARSGQHAAALRQYQDLTRLLERELDAQPDAQSAALYEAVRLRRMPKIVSELEQTRPPGQSPSDSQLAGAPDVAGAPTGSPPGAQPQPVGRQLELARLDACLARTLAGTRQLVFVTGEAGIGKTTLVEQFLGRAAGGERLRVALGRCIEHHGQGEAYLPILDALGGLCRAPDSARLLELLKQYAPSWLVQLPGLIDSAGLAALQPRVIGTTRERMLREMGEALEAASQEQPLLLVLEDLHWSDSSTVDLLAWLARRQTAGKLLIIATYRPADTRASGHPLHDVAAELCARGHAQELSLALLAEAEVGAYLAGRLAHAPVAAELAGLVHQRTEGNPLFMVSIVDLWVAQHFLAEQDGAWALRVGLEELARQVPESLRQLIELQLQQLSGEDRALLEAASVAGVEFAAALLADADQADEEIEARCAALARQGRFLRAGEAIEWPDGTSTAQFGFLHQLYQEVLYANILVSRRVRLHRALGERLEAAFGPQALAIAPTLATHFVRGRDPQRAVRYLRASAEQALGRSAHRQAIAHLEQAIELLRLWPTGPERDRQELVLQLMRAPALIATEGWGSLSAERAYARAQELCGALEDPVLRGQVQFWQGIMFEFRAEYTKSQALIEQRLSSVETRQDELLVESYDLLACSLFHQGKFGQALEQAEYGVQFYIPEQHYAMTLVASGENPGVGCHTWASLALWFLGLTDRAVQRAEQACGLARPHLYSLANAQLQAACVHQLRGEYEETRRLAERAIELATIQGFPYRVAVGTIFHGWALAIEGDYDAGLAQLREGLAACRAAGAMIDYPYYLALLAEACARAGRIEEGRLAVAGGLAMVQSSRAFYYEAELHRLRGELLLQADRHANASAAEQSFLKAREVARHQRSPTLELRAALSLGHLWREQGRAAEALGVLAEPYGRLAEGFDTADLRAARALLDALDDALPEPPRARPDVCEQQIRFCRSADGTQIAYARFGQGPTLVKAANWLSHLEHEWNSPVWRHWLLGLTQSATLVRYDERGCGLSDWQVAEISLDAMVADLEAVVDANELDRFPLLALSHGGAVAISYAVRHPERVSKLILYGTSARGWQHRRGSPQARAEAQARVDLIRLGWGKDNPAFRQFFTSLFIPEATPEQIQWFNELQRITSTPENAARLVEAASGFNVSELTPCVQVPTLVIHARDDAVVPFEEGRRLAATIPGAQFVMLDSKNHILLENEPAWQRFLDVVGHFLSLEFSC